MIHAYLFVTENNRDRDGHGPTFQQWMHSINQAGKYFCNLFILGFLCFLLYAIDLEKTNITIFHTFHEEVNSYRKHIWRCNVCTMLKFFNTYDFSR